MERSFGMNSDFKDRHFSGYGCQQNQSKYRRRNLHRYRYREYKRSRWSDDSYIPCETEGNVGERNSPYKHQSSKRLESSNCSIINPFSNVCINDEYLLDTDKRRFSDKKIESHCIEEEFLPISDDYNKCYIYSECHSETLVNKFPGFNNNEQDNDWRPVFGNLKKESRNNNDCSPMENFPKESKHKVFAQEICDEYSFKTNQRQRPSLPVYYTAIDAFVKNPGVPALSIPKAMPMIANIDEIQASRRNAFAVKSTGKSADNFSLMNGPATVLDHVKSKNINFSKCVLYPPSSEIPLPTVEGKQFGCKTAFVQGLPEKADENIIMEVFSHCGAIPTVQMCKDNCCYITFASENFVESALYFSGYTMKIKNKAGWESQCSYTGQLHICYSHLNGDRCEYANELISASQDSVCKKSKDEKKSCNKLKDEEKPIECPLIVYYSEKEALALGKKLQKEETFREAVNILCTWLEKAKCNKKNASFFYSLIQSTYSHVRRLEVEKTRYEEEFNKAKVKFKHLIECNIPEIKDICKVLDNACLPKAWPHFTKAQRKNIKLWKEKTEEIKGSHVALLLTERVEDDMEVSDNENENNTNVIEISTTLEEKNDKLCEERENDPSVSETSTTLETEINKLCQESENCTNVKETSTTCTDETNKLREEIKALNCKLESAEKAIVALRSELDLKKQEIELKECYVQSLKDQLEARP